MGYSNEALRRVTEELKERQARAVAQSQARREEIHTRSEEIEEIDRVLAMTAMRIFEAAMSGEGVEEKVEAIRRESQTLNQSRRQILCQMGYPEDYTEPAYVCPKCSDTGYAGADMCECMKTLLRLESLKMGGVANSDAQTFDSFSLSYYAQDRDTYSKMEKTLSAARAFAEEFVPGKENLLLMGGTGLGKTHLSTAIARRVIEGGHHVVYETAQTVFSDFEHDHFRAGRGEDSHRAEKYMTAPLLILDDLGTEFVSRFTLSCLYQLVNTRLVKGLSTVISTNLTPEELNELYDSRLTSRLLGHYRVLAFEGKDVRFQKRMEK